MTRSPERVAWAVLLLSFFAFCGLVFGGWRGLDWYLSTTTVPREARLEVLQGTVLLHEPGTRNEVNVPSNQLLREGASIRTTANSQAIIWLFDGSNVRLWPNTAVVVERMRITRHNLNLSETVLRQGAGHTRIEVAMPSTTSRRFEVFTPHADVLLREGSYGLTVCDAQTELSTRYGSATVEGNGHSVEVLRRERVTVAEGAAPSDPQPAAWNLIRNGQFADGLAFWQDGNRDEEEPIPGVVQPTNVDGRSAARFLRQGASKHAETFLFQPIGQDVTDYQQLRLTLDLKLSHQSLSGGGWRGSEYPLMVRLKYRDTYGSEILWLRGFYYQNEEGLPTNEGQMIPHGEWVRFELDLFDPAQVSPRPVNVVSVELCASGWDYDSLVTNVGLIAD